MRVLVTGYGGFLGKAVCLQLLKAGHSVTGLARQAYSELSRLGVSPLQGDIRDRDCILNACRGHDAVIHTAAKAGVWGSWDEYYNVNTQATKFIIDACQKQHVPILVHCSSPSVTFDGRHQSGIDETVPYPTRWLCHYPHTKALAEQAVLAAHEPGKLVTVALRPHLIWGEDDPHLIPRVIDRCLQKRLICIGDGNNQIDTVHVDHAASAHLLAMNVLANEPIKAGGKAYFITDGEPIGCWQWMCLLLTTAGLQVPTRHIPLGLAYALGAMLEAAYKLSLKKTEPPMTRFVAKQLGLDHYFSIDAARRDLNYCPQIDRLATLQAMRPWMEGLVRRVSPKGRH